MIHQSKPEVLFKYTNIENAIKIIQSSSLKFSNPTDFNDPFDCDVDLVSFNFNEDPHPDILLEKEIIQRKFRLNEIQFNSNENKINFWNELYREAQIEKINSTRISCFSLANDIILMWSHYADKHKGVCLAFNNFISPRFIDLNDIDDISEGYVEYSAENKINYISSDKLTGIRKIFLSKSKSWSHEQEYRYLLVNHKKDVYKFRAQFLVDIYFGLKTSLDEKEHFINLCRKENLNHVKFHEPAKHFLELSFYPINI
ncbi:DUF2971 domain-containing protein [Sediminibacterium sp.]|uniref:DUF2971 domain-containing protein n=1 Tax=Sediminibacterium sp. TaxID=1917865 RepID=UPI0025E73C56|nr:DUF2971 domain-containing protein [Sediminibacterium sp.]MBT9483044.1 DUF2971 domain-containing protein [Sediminibacterium sp.]